MQGNEIKGPGSGYLCIKRSWPSCSRGISGDSERFKNVYFSMFPGYYLTGDRATVDDSGYFQLNGSFLLWGAVQDNKAVSPQESADFLSPGSIHSFCTCFTSTFQMSIAEPH